jgi:transcriptional regulator with XRE-family HTH domain
MTEKSTSPTTVAAFLTELLATSEKTQCQISEEVGFESPNLITMFKNGTSKLPINRIAGLAKALNADPAHLLRVVMSEYSPDSWAAIEQNMGGVVLSANELDLIRKFRIATADKDPRPVSLTLKPGTAFTLVTESA